MSLFLPPGYVRNLNPRRNLDFDALGKDWQAEVYRRAAELSRERDCPVLVDIGCGSDLRDGYGFDFVIGVDLPYVARYRTQGAFLAASIDGNAPPVRVDKRCTVVCADVVEHLLDPLPLLRWLAECDAGAVLVSTPDRSRLKGRSRTGPPNNVAHVSEWAAEEFDRLLESVGFRIAERFWSAPREGKPENCYCAARG